MAIVGELSVVEISLEDDEIGIGKVEEKIGSCKENRRCGAHQFRTQMEEGVQKSKLTFTLEFPELEWSRMEGPVSYGIIEVQRREGETHSVTRDPEGVLLVNPLSLLDVLFPAETHDLERRELVVGSIGEEMTVDHRVQEPVEIHARDIGNEPSETLRDRNELGVRSWNQAAGRKTERSHLSVETNLGAESTLDQPIGVDAITVEFETGIVEDEIHTTALCLSTELVRGDVLPDLLEVISENVLLSRSEVISSGRLETLDVLFAHLGKHNETGGSA